MQCNKYFELRLTLSVATPFGYCLEMIEKIALSDQPAIAVTPSLRTLHAEMLRLCARIGYSPPALC